MTQSILVIEKARSIATALRRDLDTKTYTISSTYQLTALARAKKRQPDLIIVDTLSIPDNKIVDLCKALHKTIHAPTIALVYGSWPMEELEGTAYLMVSPERSDLCTRLQPVLAVWRHLLEQQSSGDGPVIALEELRLDMEKRCLSRKGNQVHLTPKAARLLFAFMTHPGLVLTQRWLMKEVWETDYTGDTRTLYVHVRWLRQIIEEDPGTPHLLNTIRGVGYRFDVPSQKTRRLK